MSKIIDCDQCLNAGAGCADCVVSLLLKPAYLLASSLDGPVFFTDIEQRAIGLLEDAGLVNGRAAGASRSIQSMGGQKVAGIHRY